MTNKLKILSQPLVISNNYLQYHTLYNTGWRRQGIGHDVKLIHYQNRFAWLTAGNVNHRSVLVNGVIFGTMWLWFNATSSVEEYIGYIDLTADVWEWHTLGNMNSPPAVVNIVTDNESVQFSWSADAWSGLKQLTIDVNTRTIVESNAKCN